MKAMDSRSMASLMKGAAYLASAAQGVTRAYAWAARNWLAASALALLLLALLLRWFGIV